VADVRRIIPADGRACLVNPAIINVLAATLADERASRQLVACRRTDPEIQQRRFDILQDVPSLFKIPSPDVLDVC